MTSKRKPKKDQFDERTRFNWGYHDAAQDVREEGRFERGEISYEWRTRKLVETFDDSMPRTRQVSKMDQGAYYYGYREGLDDARAGLYGGNSQEAWDRTSTHATVLVLRQTAKDRT